MILFSYEGKKYIKIVKDGLPDTIIKCEATDNDTILKICEEWIKAMGLKEVEWHVDVRLR